MNGSLTDTLGLVGPVAVQTFAGGPPPAQHPLMSLLTGVADLLFMEIRRLLRQKIPVVQLRRLTRLTSLLC